MNFTPRFVSYLLLSTVCCHPSDAQSANLRAVVAKLQSVRTSDEMETAIPPHVRSLLKELKHELRDLITQVLNSPDGSVASTANLESAITERLREIGIAPQPRKTVVYSGPDSLTEDTWHPYGQINAIRVEKPDSHPELLAVVTTLNISCGEDSSLYVFERKQDAWVLTMQREENDYAEVSGAMEGLQYRISPSDERGDWFLLTAGSRPWCTSCWSGVRYKVLRRSSDPERPLLMYDSEGGFYRCANKSFQLTTGKDEFSLSYPNMMSRDVELFAKINVDHFRIDKNGVHRLPPRAQPPVDFVDQWLELPEDEAMKLVDEPARVLAVEWHRRLSDKTATGENHAYESTYDVVRECLKKPGKWIVGLSVKEDAQTRKQHIPPHIFFDVKAEKSGTVLVGIHEGRQTGCQGPGQKPTGADLNDLQLPE